MPRITQDFKDGINAFSNETLVEIIIKLASKDKAAFEFINVNYLEKGSGELELYDATLDAVYRESGKRQKGYSEELKLANMLGGCIKHVNYFTKASKNKLLEARLLMAVLEIPIEMETGSFGTCFTQYDTKFAIILRRIITLVTTKLHEDHRSEFVDSINEYLTMLHRSSNHIDTVYNLPESV